MDKLYTIFNRTTKYEMNLHLAYMLRKSMRVCIYLPILFCSIIYANSLAQMTHHRLSGQWLLLFNSRISLLWIQLKSSILWMSLPCHGQILNSMKLKIQLICICNVIWLDASVVSCVAIALMQSVMMENHLSFLKLFYRWNGHFDPQKWFNRRIGTREQLTDKDTIHKTISRLNTNLFHRTKNYLFPLLEVSCNEQNWFYVIIFRIHGDIMNLGVPSDLRWDIELIKFIYLVGCDDAVDIGSCTNSNVSKQRKYNKLCQ